MRAKTAEAAQLTRQAGLRVRHQPPLVPFTAKSPSSICLISLVLSPSVRADSAGPARATALISPLAPQLSLALSPRIRASPVRSARFRVQHFARSLPSCASTLTSLLVAAAPNHAGTDTSNNERSTPRTTRARTTRDACAITKARHEHSARTHGKGESKKPVTKEGFMATRSKDTSYRWPPLSSAARTCSRPTLAQHILLHLHFSVAHDILHTGLCALAQYRPAQYRPARHLDTCAWPGA